MDGKDYSVYSILPPYNTIHAQLINSSGKLVKDPRSLGVTVTFQSVADAAGSINTTAVGKTNFWDFAKPLYGAAVAPDMGLAGYAMPGRANTPRPMAFDSGVRWFTAEGIPISPYDDKGMKNYYPMMRLIAKDRAGKQLAKTDIVLPVSDELDCRSCHASGSNNTARPAAGWTYFAADDERDYKFNVLRLHDERHRGQPAFTQALAAKGYHPAGLYETVTTNGTPILCAACHGSNALPGTGVAGISPLTQAIHARHAQVLDPVNNLPLDSVDNRSACYRCHPGSETRCLRGAMGSALAADGTMQMQCQSCHGGMSAVGASGRQGWLQQPSCQNCHTGTALANNGKIRFTSAFDTNGLLRAAINSTFATNANTPAAGLDLYRFSKGHGGLQCEACHGSTHAEYPSSHASDNVQSVAMQGHTGTLAECTACHSKMPETNTGGPHGLHPIGQYWVDKHEDAAEKNRAACRSCHGLDYRGTELSRAQAPRTFKTEWGTRAFAKGRAIGCYDCHNGPRGD
ncbi:MAG: hypothetical protein IT162_14620 [Bryobacterales bacterium]|nr:hypothetical protein [Bryobacterales bacterium]